MYGISLGIAAGIAPGPLLTLVVSETLKGNRTNGMLIALSPLITDLPIIVVTVYSLQFIADNELFQGLLSVAGGLFLIYLSIQEFRFDPSRERSRSDYRNSLRIGIMTNLLSPHPYIFWTVIGAPTFIKAGTISVVSQVLFVFGLYLMLVGSKVVVAIVSAKAKNFIRSSAYQNIIRFMSLVLLVLACILLYEGFQLLTE